MKKVFLLFCFNALFFATSTAQVIGTLFTETEADNLFGKAKVSVEIQSLSLKNLVGQSELVGDKTWFWNDNQATTFIVTGKNKSILFTTGDANFENKVSHAFSNSMILTLLGNHPGKAVYLQLRDNGVFSLQIEGEVLERASSCPPLCID